MKIRYFFILQDQTIRGPFRGGELDRRYREGTLSGDTPISPDKICWHPLKEVLYVHPETVLPTEGPEKNDPDTGTALRPETGKTEDKVLTETEKTEDKDQPETDALLEDELEPDAGEVIGQTLQFLWNTPDILESLSGLSERMTGKVFLPAVFFFSLLLTQASALSAGCFFAGTLVKTLFVTGLMFCMMGLTFLEFLCFLKRGSVVHVLLMTGMTWIQSAAVTCTGALFFALAKLPAKGTLPAWSVWIFGAFTLFWSCFFLSNLCAGCRLGLASFFALRPRTCNWIAALLLTQHFGILILAEKLAEKVL